MNKIYKFSAWWMACLVLLSSLTFTACETNDVDTNQYKGGISLNVFGPSPVLRGGELRFLGCGMDQVASVLIPGCDAIYGYTAYQCGRNQGDCASNSFARVCDF